MVWKNSSLAVLFHGLTANEQTGHLVNTKDMETAAQDMSVQLQEDANDDLHLVGAQRIPGGMKDAKSARLRRLLGAEKSRSLQKVV